MSVNKSSAQLNSIVFNGIFAVSWLQQAIIQIAIYIFHLIVKTNNSEFLWFARHQVAYV